MLTGHFTSVLPRLGLSSPRDVVSGEHWQFWSAEEERAFGRETVYLLYFDSKSTWGSVSRAAAELKRRFPGGVVHTTVVQNSADIARDLARIQKECASASIYTARQLLLRSVARSLGISNAPGEEGPDQLYIDPDLSHPGGGEPAKALGTLAKWITDDAVGGSRIGVLSAKAGVGKTTVARRLFRHLRSTSEQGRVPILVESDQWAKLSERASLTLWDIWRESLDTLYACSITRDDVEMCVEHGLFLPIFDGFDELCTRLGTHFTPGETFDRLADLAGTDGKILLTTRDAFWENVSEERKARVVRFELHPFNKPQTGRYLEARFPNPPDHHKRETARVILQRISQAAHHEEQPRYAERLAAVPLVVMLAAECAEAEASNQSLTKYGNLLNPTDPLKGILLILFDRERERRKLAASPEDQLRLFQELAFECGPDFSREDLKLYASAHCGLPASGPQQLALESHVVLCNKGERFGFRFEFLVDYLTARALVDQMYRYPTPPKVLELLSREAAGGSLLLERASNCITAQGRTGWPEAVGNVWRQLDSDELFRAKSGMLHLISKLVEHEAGTQTRTERTAALRRYLGIGPDQPISQLCLEGTLSGFDFRGCTFEKSRFANCGFANCLFDRDTRFVSCSFEGLLDIQDCRGFGDVRLEQCDLGPRARDTVQVLLPPTARPPITPEQVRSTVRLALEKFQRGVGFKSIARVYCNSGRISQSPICHDVWRALEKFGVVASIHISGVPEGGAAIGEGKKGEVQNFLSNAMLTGSLKEAVEWLETQVGAVPEKKAADQGRASRLGG